MKWVQNSFWFKSQRIKVAFQTDESATGGTIWDLKSVILLLKTCLQCYKRSSSRRIKNRVNHSKYSTSLWQLLATILEKHFFLLLLQSSDNLTKIQSYQKTHVRSVFLHTCLSPLVALLNQGLVLCFWLLVVSWAMKSRIFKEVELNRESKSSSGWTYQKVRRDYRFFFVLV